jgi:hypothetical protein
VTNHDVVDGEGEGAIVEGDADDVARAEADACCSYQREGAIVEGDARKMTR